MRRAEKLALLATLAAACANDQAADDKADAPATIASNAVATTPLPVPQLGQIRGRWCWAATTEMIMRTFEARGLYDALSQCEVAEHRYGKGTGESSGPCRCGLGTAVGVVYKAGDQGGWPALGGAFGFDCKVHNCPVPWETLNEEVRAGRPVAFSRLAAQSSVRHVMTVFDTRVAEDGRKFVLYRDSLGGCAGRSCIVDYPHFVADSTKNHVQYKLEYLWLGITPVEDGEGREGNCPLDPQTVKFGAVDCKVETGPPMQPETDEKRLPARVLEAYGEFLTAMSPQDREAMGLARLASTEAVSVGEPLIEQVLAGSEIEDSTAWNQAVESAETVALSFPLEANGDTEALITVYYSAKGWVAGKLCRSKQDLEAINQRDELVKKGIDPAMVKRISLPLVGLEVLSHPSFPGRLVVPLNNQGEFSLEIGQSLASDTLFKRVSKVALEERERLVNPP